MEFRLSEAIQVLSSTPHVLKSLLGGLSEDWINQNEGPETWSPYDIIGHLIHGEKTDWIPRAQIVLSYSKDKRFVPFDRFAQFSESAGKTMETLLEEFEILRKQNINILESLKIKDNDYQRIGIHPEFGEVTFGQLLSTWVAHDLGHISQIVRVMAKRYKEDAGPWVKYLMILN